MLGYFGASGKLEPGPMLGRRSDRRARETYLWLVGNGGMGTIIGTITTILPFPTNRRARERGLASQTMLEAPIAQTAGS